MPIFDKASLKRTIMAQLEEMVEVRWKLPKRILKKIAHYQIEKNLLSKEQAASVLLDKVTEKIKLVEA